MPLYFSPSTRGFYDADIHVDFPADVRPVTAQRREELLAQGQLGRIIMPDENGDPVAVDPPPLDNADLLRRLREKRDRLLRESDFAVLPDAPFTATRRAEWTAYRQALRDLPESCSEDPGAAIWPVAPAAL
ncbi:Phage tail assembly chaperone protein [Sphingomonas laterariae]|uniref:Phage tail assembly chaperone protein n=1 Tax=Edaphosphingomonas laterariae TaxID=861865 RepID=A0A239CJT7_9SPHN|nr:tail fiber assembly protein [Sphingomonas laterariae]SNS20427.1 Phage tail assembly chaperone protein [Sphingomonas laterariae]